MIRRAQLTVRAADGARVAGCALLITASALTASANPAAAMTALDSETR